MRTITEVMQGDHTHTRIVMVDGYRLRTEIHRNYREADSYGKVELWVLGKGWTYVHSLDPKHVHERARLSNVAHFEQLANSLVQVACDVLGARMSA